MKVFLINSLIMIIMLVLSSCAPQNLLNTKHHQPYDTSKISYDSHHVYKIKSDDKLTISIWSHDDLSVGSLFGIYNSNEVYGKWVMVDQKGNAALPQIGLVHLEGMTTLEAGAKLTELYKALIVNPIIVVKVLNREVTILGEVKNPGNYTLDKENNNVLELLGKAGGLDFYANKKKIQIVVGQGKDLKQYRLDLTKAYDYKAQNINLQGGEVIIVPSRHGKILDKKAPSVVPFISAVTAIIVVLKFFGN